MDVRALAVSQDDLLAEGSHSKSRRPVEVAPPMKVEGHEPGQALARKRDPFSSFAAVMMEDNLTKKSSSGYAATEAGVGRPHEGEDEPRHVPQICWPYVLLQFVVVGALLGSTIPLCMDLFKRFPGVGASYFSSAMVQEIPSAKELATRYKTAFVQKNHKELMALLSTEFRFIISGALPGSNVLSSKTYTRDVMPAFLDSTIYKARANPSKFMWDKESLRAVYTERARTIVRYRPVPVGSWTVCRMSFDSRDGLLTRVKIEPSLAHSRKRLVMRTVTSCRVEAP